MIGIGGGILEIFILVEWILDTNQVTNSLHALVTRAKCDNQIHEQQRNTLKN